MVLFDTLLCGTCDALHELQAWGFVSGAVDAIVIVIAILFLFGYSWDLPLWLALNIGLNLALKYLIGDPRPGACGCGPGMPSSHAQLGTFFFCVYLYWELRRCSIFSLWRTLLATALVVLVSISRGTLGYHSAPQILVGNALGLILGVIYIVTHAWCPCKKK